MVVWLHETTACWRLVRHSYTPLGHVRALGTLRTHPSAQVKNTCQQDTAE